MASQGFDIIIHKLDAFIRKYYRNQLIRGLIYSGALFLLFFLSVALLEYFGQFGIAVRTSMFYGFILVNFLIFSRYIFIPLFHLFKIGKTLTYTDAAKIVGNHFSDVKDKLINTLQLNSQVSGSDNSLLLASIEQRTNELKPVPFTAAIDMKENRKYLPYFFIPFFIVSAILLFSPSILTDSTRRIVSHGTYFEPKAPFAFMVLNKELVAIEGEDFELNMKFSGTEIPDQAYIQIAGVEYKMNKNSNLEFSHVFVSPQKDIPFFIAADGFKSKQYTLKVVPKPLILLMNMNLEYPAYLRMKPETISNQGDLTVPQGTQVQWTLNTKNTESLAVLWNDTVLRQVTDKNNFSFKNRLLSDLNYSIVVGNQFLPGRDTVKYSIKVIPDLYPSIDVLEEKDSIFITRLIFKGEIQDDYGLRKLSFHYKKEHDKTPGDWKQVNIPINGGQTEQSFYHYFDTKSLEMELGDKLVYYFEVWDNDGVNGSKSARTGQRVFSLPTKEEMKDKIEATNQSIKSDLSDNLESIQEINKEIDDLTKNLLQKKNMNWDDKNRMEKLLEKQKDLQDKIKETQDKNKQNENQKEELSEDEKRLLEKQEEINKRFDELDNDELNKMLEELDKLMEKMDKNKLQEMLKDMKMTNQDMEKELDRTLELFKQMEFEQKLDDVVNELDKLQKEQEKLSEDTKNKTGDNKDLENKQKELNDKFKELKEDLNKLNELNKDLENKHDMPDTKNQEQQIEQDMQDASDQLQKNQNNKSSQNQKNASQKMDQMKQQMQQMQQQMQSNNNQENLEDLRQILDNLLKLSFDQEDLLEQVKKINKNNPQYKDLLKNQHKLVDDSKIIEDSLMALSKRMAELESFVNKEISAVKNNMNESLDYLEERNTGLANQKQQYALTSINNLALMLSEAIDQMQQQMKQQMQQQMQGNNSCTKPGSSNPNMNGLIQKQQALQKKMGELQQKMKGEGKKDGDGNGGTGEGQLNKELVKLASEQEMIRNELQNMMNGMNQDQRKTAQEILKKMEENETDLLNKRITSETIRRQNDITIKMMESEKALREQEQDEKRKSNEGEDKLKSSDLRLEEYFKRKQTELELIKTIPPAFKPYYKSKVSNYFNRF